MIISRSLEPRLGCVTSVALVLAATFMTMRAPAQVGARYEQPIAVPLRIAMLPDTVDRRAADSVLSDIVATGDTVVRAGKSTMLAWVGSAVIPGSGQIYNGAYWKVPIVWGVGYYFYRVYKEQDDLYRDYRTQYANSVTASVPLGNARLRSLRDFYRGQRDTFGWYLAILYLLNVLDAYVDASLYNFEVSPDLQPVTEGRFVSVRIRL